jgi:hypothetical protein
MYGLIFGVGIGAGVGILFGNLPLGAGVGAAIGLVFGSPIVRALSAAKRKKPDA